MQWFRQPGFPHRLPRGHSMFRESQQQVAIGWNNFLRGHIAQTLIDYQEAYFRAREKPAEETGQQWASKLIQILWRFFFDQWKLRCDERHSQDKEKISKQQKFRIHARTSAVYAALPNLPAAIRALHWFVLPLDRQLSTSTRKLEVWLAHTEVLVQQGLAETANYLEAGHQDIRTFFAPRVPIPPPPD